MSKLNKLAELEELVEQEEFIELKEILVMMEIEEILELEEMADRENEFQKCSFGLAVGHGLYEKGNMDERKSCKQFSNEGRG